MSLFHLALIALIQGLTEFLPVSSSGHLILLPLLTDLPDQGLALDVAVHVGTLFAVVLYFWRDVSSAIGGVPRLLTGRIDTPGSKLAFLMGVATVPVVIAGFCLSYFDLTEGLRSIKVIGWAMLGFGLVLFWADRNGPVTKSAEDWSVADAIKLGLWQVLALIPGTSRSGITITGARAMGYGRASAARIAMLMSIPTILASGTLLGLDVLSEGAPGQLGSAAIAALLAFLAALAALGIMMRLLRSISFTPYVIYRVALGAILLWIGYS